jgi:hypothetical protein
MEQHMEQLRKSILQRGSEGSLRRLAESQVPYDSAAPDIGSVIDGENMLGIFKPSRQETANYYNDYPLSGEQTTKE